jgi:hypothetical protein
MCIAGAKLRFLGCCYGTPRYWLHLRRTSGVTDHYAQNDDHAIEIARSIVANLNWHDVVSESSCRII